MYCIVQGQDDGNRPNEAELLPKYVVSPHDTQRLTSEKGLIKVTDKNHTFSPCEGLAPRQHQDDR